MGQKHKQFLKKREESVFPRFVEEVEEVTGGAGITWQIDWESFARNIDACRSFEMPEVCFH